jgi:hypothetical protein
MRCDDLDITVKSNNVKVTVCTVMVAIVIYVLHFCEIRSTVRPRNHWHAATPVELVYPLYLDNADPSGRAVYGVGLRPSACRDR